MLASRSAWAGRPLSQRAAGRRIQRGSCRQAVRHASSLAHWNPRAREARASESRSAAQRTTLPGLTHQVGAWVAASHRQASEARARASNAWSRPRPPRVDARPMLLVAVGVRAALQPRSQNRPRSASGAAVPREEVDGPTAGLARLGPAEAPRARSVRGRGLRRRQRRGSQCRRGTLGFQRCQASRSPGRLARSHDRLVGCPLSLPCDVLPHPRRERPGPPIHVVVRIGQRTAVVVAGLAV